MVGEVEAVDFEGNTFYQLNKATLVPLADFLADAHLGNYAICAVASTGEYDGSFSSGRIELFQGYEVEVAAKEFITYYKDEPLYVEDEAAELYTIESVNGDQAVLSDRSDAMPSNTPMLVYNKSNETKVILLIPCAEPDMAITVARQHRRPDQLRLQRQGLRLREECHRDWSEQGMAERQHWRAQRTNHAGLR